MEISEYMCGAVRQFDDDYIVEPPFETWEVELHPVSKESYQQ